MIDSPLAPGLTARVRGALDAAQRRIHVRAWHLENLMPEDALSEVPPGSARPAPR